MGLEYKKTVLAELNLEFSAITENVSFKNMDSLIAYVDRSIDRKIKEQVPSEFQNQDYLSLPRRAAIIVDNKTHAATGRKITGRFVNVEKWENDYLTEYRANFESADLVALRDELSCPASRGFINSCQHDGFILVGSDVNCAKSAGAVARIARNIKPLVFFSVAGFWTLSASMWLLSGSQQSNHYEAETLVYALVSLALIFGAKVASEKGDNFQFYLFAAVAAILTAWSF